MLLMPELETGVELYCNLVGEVLGDTGCLIGDFFGRLDEGDPMELDELEFFGDKVQVSGGEGLLLRWLDERETFLRLDGRGVAKEVKDG